jgi:putative nucleotidyltransferase with HDIG domain
MTENIPGELKKFKGLVAGLARLLMQRNLFPPGHPSVQRALTEAMEALYRLTGKNREITVRYTGTSLCFLNFEVDLAESNISSFHFLKNSLDKLSVGEIALDNSIEKDELLALMEIAGSTIRNDRSFDLQSAWRRISNIKIRHGKALDPVGRTPDPVPENQSRELIRSDMVRRDGKESMAGVITRTLDHLEKIHSMERRKAGKMILDLVESGGRNHTSILLLRSLKEYDHYTFDHSVNVAVLCASIASNLGFGEDEAGGIGMAALMHDIGKLYVPRKILQKRGRLSPSEWQHVKRHPVDGEKILREEGSDLLTRKVAYEHHMRYDMTGYPTPREGERCLDASNIVRIADSYDALTTKRPYRRQLSPFEAIKLMEKTQGSEFHPAYLDRFMQILGNIPIGSTMTLESGEKVLVIEIGCDGRLPRVRVLTDADGKETDDDIILDLNELDPVTRQPRYRISAVTDEAVREVKVGTYLVPV